MYDRPTLNELIEAARGHLEAHVIPAIKGDPKLYFQTLVAINVLRIAERELALGWDHLLAEWERLDVLTRDDQPNPTDMDSAVAGLAARNADLCAAIRAGAYDDSTRKSALFTHLVANATAALEVANPKFLAALASEG
jgi:hypothetical protein